MSKISIGSEWVGHEGNVKVTGVRQSGLSGLTMIKYDNLTTGLWNEKDIESFIDSFVCASDEQREKHDEKLQTTPVIVGDIWVGKTEKDYWLKVMRLEDGKVFTLNKSHETVVYKLDHFIGSLEPKFVATPTIAVDSVWRCKDDGELVYIESTDDTLCPINFNELHGKNEYCDNVEKFVSRYEFVCESKYDSSLAFCDVVLGVKHGHYHKDVSKYKTMDIYAICKVWNAEPSGCTHHALKKLLHAGERGAKSKITDLEQAIESIEALIKLEKMDIRGDS